MAAKTLSLGTYATTSSAVSFGLMHASFAPTSASHTACGCWSSKAEPGPYANGISPGLRTRITVLSAIGGAFRRRAGTGCCRG